MCYVEHMKKVILLFIITAAMPPLGARSIKEVMRTRLRIPLKRSATELNLAGRGITSLDGIEEVARKYPKLEKLYLANNHLEYLPNNITHLKNLTWLDLGNNKLKELPRRIKGLWRLKHLSLGGNELQRLPKEIAELERLQWLDVSGNYLEPTTIEFLQRSLLSAALKTSEQRLKPNIPITPQHICGICFEGNVDYKTACGHYFHTQELFAHIKSSGTTLCPLCRQSIYTQGSNLP